MEEFGQTKIVERSAMEAIERASIDIQISTAQQFPKHTPEMMSRVKSQMITLATDDEETASSCMYSLPRGGRTIQGASIRMAEIAQKCYGSLRIQTQIVSVVETGDTPHVIVRGMVHDLENNVAQSTEVRRRITKKKNKPTVDEDDIQLAVAACSAIARRNAILSIIPNVFIRPVLDAARKVAIGNVKSLATKRQAVIERLNAMGATTDRILAVVGCLKVEDIGLENLETLIGLGTALKDGDTMLEDAFPPIVPEPKPGVAGLKDKLKGNPAPADEPSKITGADLQAAADEKTTQPVDMTGVPPVDPDLMDPPADQGSDSENPNNSEPNSVKARYRCNDCKHEFDAPKGKDKNLCASCLSKNVTDRSKVN